jgi:predicted ATPase
MVAHLTGGKALPAAVMQHIVAKSDGVPLFVEELTKAVLALGVLQEQADRYELTGPLPALAIPTTLHDALLARLDRLGDAKAVAQLGAVLGRTFSYELLRAVAPLDELVMWRGLVQLVEAEVLYQQGVPPQATYLFKHALLQEAAYQSLLRSTRQQYHARTAQVMAERFPETAETQPELLAHHYTEAGLAEAAVDYWQRAGRLALRRSAQVEAIAHLTKGLEVLQTLPDTPARTQHELRLQSPLIWALVDIKGYTAPEAYRASTRLYELASQMGDTEALLSGLRGMWVFHAVRAEWHTARQLAEQCYTVAQRIGHQYALLSGHYLLGETLLSLGELARAREYLEHAMALYDPQQHRPQVSGAHQDLGVSCHLFVASVLWMLGYPDQARQRSRAALRLAQELAHPYSLTWALAFTAEIHIRLGDFPTAQAQAEAAIALATEQGFALMLACGTFLRGWALAAQGQAEEGITQMRLGLDAIRATGDRSALGSEAVLAEALGQAGQAGAGLRRLAEALAAVPTTGERVLEAEMQRCKGELLLAQAGKRQRAKGKRQKWAEAEACFRQALDVASQQQAKSLELRAAISLSRLWQRQSKRVAAYELLAEVYGWFTEGFDTADLQEAKALLDVLRTT